MGFRLCFCASWDGIWQKSLWLGHIACLSRQFLKCPGLLFRGKEHWERSHSERWLCQMLQDSGGRGETWKPARGLVNVRRDECYWTQVSEGHSVLHAMLVCSFQGWKHVWNPLWWWLVSVQINPQIQHSQLWTDNINIYFKKMWGSPVFTIFMKYNKCHFPSQVNEGKKIKHLKISS